MCVCVCVYKRHCGSKARGKYGEGIAEVYRARDHACPLPCREPKISSRTSILHSLMRSFRYTRLAIPARSDAFTTMYANLRLCVTMLEGCSTSHLHVNRSYKRPEMWY